MSPTRIKITTNTEDSGSIVQFALSENKDFSISLIKRVLSEIVLLKYEDNNNNKWKW